MRGGGERGVRESGARTVLTYWMMRELPGLGWALAGVYRRKWTVAAVWVGLTAAAAAWVWRLPAVYQAEAVVLVESRRIPEDMVPATVATDLGERLGAALQKLQASAQLQQVIWKFNLYAGLRKDGANEDSLVTEMRKALRITPVDLGVRGRWGPFRVTFQGTDPRTAAQVANHVAWRFVEEASQARRSSAVAATRFLSSQVASARKSLEEQEAAIREFKLRYSEELPEQAELLRASARRLRTELAGLREEILNLEDERSALETAARMEAPTAGEEERDASAGGYTNDLAVPRQSRIEEVRQRLTSLLAVYKPEHPDVRRVAAELARAESLEAEAARSRAEAAPRNPKPATPRQREQSGEGPARLRLIDSRLSTLAARRTQVAAELGATEEPLQSMPLRQQELAALLREHALSSEQFRSVATRQRLAEMAEAMERSYPPERVTVLDEAPVPQEPIGPNRWLMLGLASLGALATGCLLGLARDLDFAPWYASSSHELAPVEENHSSIPPGDGWVAVGSAREAGCRLAGRG